MRSSIYLERSADNKNMTMIRRFINWFSREQYLAHRDERLTLTNSEPKYPDKG